MSTIRNLRHIARVIGCAAALSFIATLAVAAGLEPPTGPVILTVSGAIATHNQDGSAAFDRAQLEALPQVTVRTETPWTDGFVEFRGPLVRTVLKTVGAAGTSVRATAINDYSVEIPVDDFDSHEVILALLRDGKPMRVRDRGPLWIIYPLSGHAELRDEIHHGRSIWQLRSLVVE